MIDFTGQVAAAEKRFREVLEVRERVLGPDDPFTLNNAIQMPLTSTVLPVPGGISSTFATVINSDMRPQDFNAIVMETRVTTSAEWPQSLISTKSYGIEHNRAYPDRYKALPVIGASVGNEVVEWK